MSRALVTVCMPYFNRPLLLTDTLQGFIDHGYPDLGVHVSICDDGSAKAPARDVGLVKENPSWITLTELPRKKYGLNACVPLNRAVEASDSPLVLLQSPETGHETGFLPDMVDLVTDYNDVVLACVRCEGERRLEWFSHPTIRPKKYWWCQLVSKLFWLEVGGMDEAYRDGRTHEDDDLVERMNLAGANWIWCEKCVAVHVRRGKESVDTRKCVGKADPNRKLFSRKYKKGHAT